MVTNTDIVLPSKVMKMEEDAREGVNVLSRDEGDVRWVILNRPERHNAIDLPTAKEWAMVLGAAANDPNVRAVVLAGE